MTNDFDGPDTRATQRRTRVDLKGKEMDLGSWWPRVIDVPATGCGADRGLRWLSSGRLS